MGSVERRCACGKAKSAGCGCPSRRVRWRAVLRLPAGRKLTATFGTQSEAKMWLAQQETAWLAGTLGRQGGGNVAFRDWVVEWQAGREVLKPATRAADRAWVKALLAAFGDLPLGDISPAMVRQWVGEQSKRRASNTVRHLHAALFNIMQLAVDERLILRNPCVGTPLPQTVEREPVFLNEAEIASLIAAHPPFWRSLPLTLVGTGLRWAEAVGLRVRYVDLGRRELTVAWTYSQKFGWQTPKSKASRRVVPLPRQVVEALRGQLAGKTADEHVFTMPSGGPVTETYRVKVWRAAVKAAGLTAKGPRPHDLRHTHVSTLIAAGVPLTVIQRRLGHSTITITSDLYGHVSASSARLAADAMELALGIEIPDVVPEGL